MDDEDLRSKARDRLDVLNCILDALKRVDEINAAVRRCTDRIGARTMLQSEPYRYSDAAINHILDLTVGRQTADGVAELERERDNVADWLKRLE
jgi:DNA gyrase/topoisomerase IV subunit A